MTTETNMTKTWAAKTERRRQLARLPMPEKIRIVAQLQAMCAPIERAKGREVRIWNMDVGEHPVLYPEGPSPAHLVADEESGDKGAGRS